MPDVVEQLAAELVAGDTDEADDTDEVDLVMPAAAHMFEGEIGSAAAASRSMTATPTSPSS